MSSGRIYRFISDRIGSPRVVVDSTTGAIVQEFRYDEWGNFLLSVNPEFQPFGFAGGLRDPSHELVRLGRRDFLPRRGQWTTIDPVLFNGGAGNLYLYANASPVAYVDVNGLESILIGLGAAVATPWGGAEISGGIFSSPADGSFGMFSSTGANTGIGAGYDAFVGYVPGNSCNIEGYTENLNLGIAVLSGTLFLNPDTGSFSGFTLGLGQSVPGLNVSVSEAQTGTLNLRQLLDDFLSWEW